MATGSATAQIHSERLAGEIEGLVRALSSRDGIARRESRQLLVEIGEPAVPALVEAMKSKDETMRWEAAKALSEIHSPSSAWALADALTNEDFTVRWMAAEGLIAMGRKGLETVLQLLIRDPDSLWVREGVHHVLRVLAGRGFSNLVEPVVDALDAIFPPQPVIPRAHAALDQLEREHQR